MRLVFLILLAVAVLASEFKGTVTRVLDGDTVVVSRDDYSIRVRLYGVDTPERTQAGSGEATVLTKALVLGRAVTVVERDIDRYGRVVGDVLLPDGRMLNQEIIHAGHAWWYQKYAPLGTDLRA